MDSQGAWMGKESGRTGRVEKAGTVDAGGGVAQLFFFVPLQTFKSHQ